jgi:hypothetical protein
MQSIRNRLLVIGALVALSIFYLFADRAVRERADG